MWREAETCGSKPWYTGMSGERWWVPGSGADSRPKTPAQWHWMAFFWNRKCNGVLRVEVAVRRSGDNVPLSTLKLFKRLVFSATSGPSVAKPIHSASRTPQFLSPSCCTPPIYRRLEVPIPLVVTFLEIVLWDQFFWERHNLPERACEELKP